VDKGCLGKGCSDSMEMHGLPVGASVEGEFDETPFLLAMPPRATTLVW
jgi:hypothetical protein